MTEPTTQPTGQPTYPAPYQTTTQAPYQTPAQAGFQPPAPTGFQTAAQAGYPTADDAPAPAMVGAFTQWWQQLVVAAVWLAVTAGVFFAGVKAVEWAAPMFDRDPLSLGNGPYLIGGVAGALVGAFARFALASAFNRRNQRRSGS